MCYFKTVKFELYPAAKRKNIYQSLARYQVAINPTTSEERGDEHRKYWVVDTKWQPHFIEPGVIIRGFDNEAEAKRYRASL